MQHMCMLIGRGPVQAGMEKARVALLLSEQCILVLYSHSHTALCSMQGPVAQSCHELLTCVRAKLWRRRVRCHRSLAYLETSSARWKLRAVRPLKGVSWCSNLLENTLHYVCLSFCQQLVGIAHPAHDARSSTRCWVECRVRIS